MGRPRRLLRRTGGMSAKGHVALMAYQLRQMRAADSNIVWNEAKEPFGWKGVTTKDGRVTSLNLNAASRSRLTAIHPSVGDLDGDDTSRRYEL